MKHSAGGSDELGIKITAVFWAGYLGCGLAGSSSCPTLELTLMSCPGFSPSCLTTHHPNSHSGDFPCSGVEGVDSKWKMLRKKDIWKIPYAPATTGFKIGSITVFHPPAASLEVQNFITHSLLLLHGICHLPFVQRAYELFYIFLHLLGLPTSLSILYFTLTSNRKHTRRTYIWQDNSKIYILRSINIKRWQKQLHKF